MFGIDDMLLAGGTSMLGGLLSSVFGGQSSEDSYTDSGYYKDMAKQFMNPNSPLYQAASQGFYNRMNDASPTLNSLLGFARSQGLSGQGSMAIAKLQRQNAMTKNAEAANNFQSDLYSRGWNTGAGLMEMDQRGRMAYNSQKNDLWNNLGSNFLNMGSGLLGKYFAGSGSGNFESQLDPNYFQNLSFAPRQNFSDFSFGGRRG